MFTDGCIFVTGGGGCSTFRYLVQKEVKIQRVDVDVAEHNLSDVIYIFFNPINESPLLMWFDMGERNRTTKHLDLELAWN